MGLAIVNPGDEPAQVDLEAVARDGQVLAAKDVLLGPSSLSDFRGHTERASLVYGESILEQ